MAAAAEDGPGRPLCPGPGGRARPRGPSGARACGWPATRCRTPADRPRPTRWSGWPPGLGRDDLLLVLLSGGASALLPAPVAGVSLEDKAAATRLLLRAGATIHELNTVRKHLSRLKGGGLARAAAPARVAALVLSDVVGRRPLHHRLGTGGPRSHHLRRRARACCAARGMGAQVPAAVRAHLEAGIRGRRAGDAEARRPAVPPGGHDGRGQQPAERGRGRPRGPAPGPAAAWSSPRGWRARRGRRPGSWWPSCASAWRAAGRRPRRCACWPGARPR